MSESRLIEKEVVRPSQPGATVGRAGAGRDRDRTGLPAPEGCRGARGRSSALQKLKIAYETESETTEARYQEVRLGILKQRQTEHQATAAEYDGVRQRIAARYNAGKKSGPAEPRGRPLAGAGGLRGGQGRADQAVQADASSRSTPRASGSRR